MIDSNKEDPIPRLKNCQNRNRTSTSKVISYLQVGFLVKLWILTQKWGIRIYRRLYFGPAHWTLDWYLIKEEKWFESVCLQGFWKYYFCGIKLPAAFFLFVEPNRLPTKTCHRIFIRAALKRLRARFKVSTINSFLVYLFLPQRNSREILPILRFSWST